MLKFRSTNSMKARRAAETQRKALEEQLKMEWAWKPMAAVMNDNKTDLVYWVPPLYASNILSSFSSSNASSPVSSLCSSPSLSRARNLSRRATLGEVNPMASRKRRVSNRRLMTTPRQSIDEVGEELEMDGPPRRFSSAARMEEARKFDGTMKKDLIVEFEAEGIDLVHGLTEATIPENVQIREPDPPKNKKRKGSRATEGDTKLKPEGKTRSIPSILKLLEKVSHLHEKPKHRPLTRRNAKIERTMSSGSQKIKRPSLKVYQNVPKHGSGRRATAPTIPTQPPQTEAKEARMVITGRNSQGPRLSIRRASRQSSTRQSSVRSRSDSVTTTGLKVSQVTEAELRSAHLEMMIKILATLYEQKISKQDTEIKTLKDKFKTQDKIVKQVVHNMLEVKQEVKTIREHIIQHEEIFMQRNKQIITQQSIPEEIEEDLDMFETDPRYESNLHSNFIENELLAKEENYFDAGQIPDDVASAKSATTDDRSSISTVIENPRYLSQSYNDLECNCVTADVIGIEECQVLEPPDEYKSTDLDEPPITSIAETNFPIEMESDQTAILNSIKADLEAQDSNEFKIHYERVYPIADGLDSMMEEQFFASEYVADYHPKEELRLQRAKECAFNDNNIIHLEEEEDQIYSLPRQRSDDSTNI